jgi:hypothetical protein
LLALRELRLLTGMIEKDGLVTSSNIFVEEVIPEEAIQLPPKNMLFTVPENWQPPTSFPEDETQADNGSP